MLYLLSLTVLLFVPARSLDIFGRYPLKDRFERRYSVFSERQRLHSLNEARQMFYHGYDNYMLHAFPKDELNPLHCTGRGPDSLNPGNININDVLGDYCLTLVDALDTLAVIGNATEFKRAVQLVIENVSFDKDITIQVFEANIRMLGALLSAHLLIVDPKQPFGDLVPDDYNNDLLDLAHDLATRLLPAFDNTQTGIPYPRVNLRDGVPEGTTTHTCTAGAGSLLLEFGLLSRLLGDPVFEGAARRANRALWKHRSQTTGLLGNVIDVQTGRWIGRLSGIGAGLDSFYEYLLKAYILFGENDDYRLFNETYHYIKQYMRRGRAKCNSGFGDHPLYVNVEMNSGATHTTWIDSLQAAFAGIQVLAGDIEEAICAHALYYSIWKLYGALPERFNWQRVSPDVLFYPLRPELVESTYLLYQATKNPFYLHVGRDILQSLNNHTKARCGYATIHNVFDKSLEDRMESFFLSETCKYLYLLFDRDNHVNKNAAQYVFTTEGHLFPIRKEFRNKTWEMETVEDAPPDDRSSWTETLSGSAASGAKLVNIASFLLKEAPVVSDDDKRKPMLERNHTKISCDRVNEERQYFLPLERRYFSQIHSVLGLDDM